MDLIITCATVIALVVIGFILFIVMPKPKVFLDPYVDLDTINNNFDKIKLEITEINNTQPVIPIYGNNKIYNHDYPILYESCRSLPSVEYLGIINLKPKFEQKIQHGWSNNANNTIRYFLPIETSATNKSGIWVDGAKKFFTDKEWVCADVSRENSLFNKYKYKKTTVIFVDIKRPSGKGISLNESLELDDTLKLFI